MIPRDTTTYLLKYRPQEQEQENERRQLQKHAAEYRKGQQSSKKLRQLQAGIITLAAGIKQRITRHRERNHAKPGYIQPTSLPQQ